MLEHSDKVVQIQSGFDAGTEEQLEERPIHAMDEQCSIALETLLYNVVLLWKRCYTIKDE